MQSSSSLGKPKLKGFFIPPKLAPFLPFLASLTLVAACFLAYANVYDNQFLFDDEMIIVQNGLLRGKNILAIFLASSTAGVGKSDLFYRPLQTLLYYCIYNIFGLSTPAFHFLNVSLHALNAVLLYAFARKLNFNALAAFFACLIWVLHPVHTEAITYMSGTADPLYCSFGLIALLIVSPTFTFARYAVAAPLFFLALLSKEAAISLPFLALTSQFFYSRSRPKPVQFLNFAPFIVTALLYVCVRQSAIGGLHSFYATENIYSEHLDVRIYTFLATLPSYVGLIFWPHALHMDRAFALQLDLFNLASISGLLMLAVAGTILLRGDVRLRALKFGLLWAAFAYGLNSGILYPVNSLFLEHWLYLPTAGLFLALAETYFLFSNKMSWQPKLNRLAFIVSTGVAIALSVLTFEQNANWRDPITFYSHAIACGSQSSRVYNNLGMAYAAKGELSLAEQQYKIAMELSGDRSAEIRHNLALTILAQPDRDAHLSEARQDLLRAIALNPDFFQSFEMLANLDIYMNNAEEAVVMQKKADAIRKRLNIAAEVYRQPKLLRFNR